MPKPLSVRVRAAYDRCKYYPEGDSDGWVHLIELRNLMPEVIDALEDAERYVAVKRLD